MKVRRDQTGGVFFVAKSSAPRRKFKKTSVTLFINLRAYQVFLGGRGEGCHPFGLLLTFHYGPVCSLVNMGRTRSISNLD